MANEDNRDSKEVKLIEIIFPDLAIAPDEHKLSDEIVMGFKVGFVLSNIT